MSTQTVERTEIDPLTGKGRVSHIVKEAEGKTAHALVMEARVFGHEVEALCGHRWVPQRDPKQYPVCDRCKAIYESNVGHGEDLPDA